MPANQFSDRSRVYPSGPRPSRFGGPSPFSRLGTAIALGSVVVCAAAFAHHRGSRHDRNVEAAFPAAEAPLVPEEATTPGEIAADAVAAKLPVTSDTVVLGKNETLYDSLVGVGFAPSEIWALVKASKPFFNMSKVHAGMKFTVFSEPDIFGKARVVSFQMPIAANKTLLARPSLRGPLVATSYDAEVREIPYETVLTGYTGTVDVTLWESAMDAGMDPSLIDELADVFAFDIDFTKEVRQGDRYRLVVEQKLLEGKPAGYGRILAAEYVNGNESHSAIQFETATGDADYFSTDGNSLRRMFLRSPLKYRRISSRYGGRRHPTLGYWKKHEGVDYAADTGTPIRAVGDATVLKASYNGASGNFVKLKHNSTYETSYSHLKGYGPGIKAGTRVKQGQIIGYVGTTGRSTGPHLHFAFYEKGRYIDPLSKRFPSADPIPAKEKARFEKAKAALLPLLPEWPTTTASTRTTAPMPPALAAPIAAAPH